MLELIIFCRKKDWIVQLHNAALAHEKFIGQSGRGKQSLQTELMIFRKMSGNVVVVLQDGGFGIVCVVPR